MRVTLLTNYSFRSLQLAALRHPELTRVDDVVKVHRIARPHIVKAVHLLGREGFLETVRGRKGGFRLARPADQIVMGDLFRVTEGPLNLVECFDPESNSCPMIGACRFSRALSEATRAFLAVLDDLTLADMVANRDDLVARIVPLHEEMFEGAEA